MKTLLFVSPLRRGRGGGGKRVLEISGRWEIRNGSLILTYEEKMVVEGGKIVVADGGIKRLPDPMSVEGGNSLTSILLNDSITLNILPMTAVDISDAVSFVAQVMNDTEAEYAQKTMDFHFRCKSCSVDDGRDYYIVKNVDGKIAALVGLHHYEWGPAENVWLSWFGVSADLRRQGLGKKLIVFAEGLAIEKNYTKILIETYSGKDFEDARRFYSAVGYCRTGMIGNYLTDGSEMIVYTKELI